ncbi:MAG TPA: sugar porter family MFS transporter [Verrucomicrobiae bacterium]|jgi:SP family arabinose:H+ symporter-like MFS transporter|nr:sugar porter family MFS transporter [Candidatus Acidoferrum sp.]HSY32272.1 sugar porter family MFS transporter [Verrucomicrobiae bacterium]
MKLNSTLLKATAVGALGGLLFGFDTAVIAGTTHSLTLKFGLTPRQLGLTVAMALIGTIIGAMSAGIPGQRWGGRETLRVLAIFYVLSALGCAFAVSWPMLLVARFIGGLGIGGSSVLGPVYIAELAPARWRGRLVGLFQINIVLGILLAYFSNYVIGTFGLGVNEWRWQFGVAAAPAILFLVMLFGIPPSSRWLVTQKRVDEARAVLISMDAEDPENELREIVASVHLEREQTSEPLFVRKYRLPIFLAITIGMFNQLSGINAILYYLNDIFAAAGYSKISGDLQAVAIGAMNLVATLFGMTLIDKLGRKTLLIIGSVGTALCLAGVAEIFYTQAHQNYLIWLLVTYIAFFAVSQGAVIWVYIGEVFPNRVRSKGQALGSSSHWIMNAIIAYTFPQVAKSSGAYPFMFFAAMMVLQFFVVLFFYPETKNVTLEQMQRRLGID